MVCFQYTGLLSWSKSTSEKPKIGQVKVPHCESSLEVDEEDARACHFVVSHSIDLLAPEEHDVVPHVCTTSVADLQD